MLRLIRPLRIIEGKCFFQNMKMASSMSQSHVHHFSNEQKKELGTESKNIQNDPSIEIEETNKIKDTNAGDKLESNFFYESIEKMTKGFAERKIIFGQPHHPNLIVYSEEHLSMSNTNSLIQFLRHLVSTKQRPVNLMKCAIQRLGNIQHDFTLLDCSVLMYSLSRLSYRDETLLNRISETIKSKKSEFMEGILPVTLLHSFGMLRYRNCEVIDILLQCVLKHKELRTPDEKLTALMTLAVLNYKSPLGTALLNEMLTISEQDFSSSKSYLDFVWASVILNHLLEKHISLVLSDEFVSRLFLSTGSSAYEICSSKLLNINAAALTLLNGYTKPFLNKKFYKTIHQTRSKMIFTRLVVEGLAHLYPKNRDIRVNIDTGAGFILDVEFSNKNNGYNTSRNFSESDDQKVGIILLGYYDVCFDEAKTIVGFNTFKQRILEAKNYKTVTIPYTEYNESMKLFEKTEYLKKKLTNAIDT